MVEVDGLQRRVAGHLVADMVQLLRAALARQNGGRLLGRPGHEYPVQHQWQAGLGKGFIGGCLSGLGIRHAEQVGAEDAFQVNTWADAAGSPLGGFPWLGESCLRWHRQNQRVDARV